MLPVLIEFMKPDVIAKMASGAGISDVASAQKTISGAVPAVLSGLTGVASKPEGARQLSAAIAGLPSNLLEDLSGMTGGVGQLASIGNTALVKLFSSTTLDTLASTLARFGAIGEAPARTLLSMVAPVILAALGREIGASVGALTQFLASQKDKFVGAIPPALSDLFKMSGIDFEQLGTVSPIPLNTPEPDRATGRVARAMISAPPASSARWAYWVIPAFALAGVLWYVAGGDRTIDRAAKGPSQDVQRAARGSAADRDLQTQITALLQSLDGTVAGIKNAGSAAQGLPRLQQAAGELDRLGVAADRLPVETREQIAEAIKVMAARLRATLDDVTAIPQVGADVLPVVSALRKKVDTLARTPGSAQQRAGQATDRIVYLVRTPKGGLPVRTYFDRGVHNRAGEKIGSISDLVVTSDGTIAAALINVSGFLGIGAKQVAVPFSSIELVGHQSDWRFVVDATKDALRDAPSYEDAIARERLTPQSGTNR
jgi:sporulation protein YlmC with PRC-barrel domain